MRAHREGEHVHADAPALTQLHDVLELLAHDLRATDHLAQDRFGEQKRHLGRVEVAQDSGPFETSGEEAVPFLVALGRVS
ncbi:hypothetical protein GCM10010344_42950 [Streptomyces bluensis]|nr:hypothetical protein GCM10010344_42950 [Streptomyces bluensis]